MHIENISLKLKNVLRMLTLSMKRLFVLFFFAFSLFLASCTRDNDNVQAVPEGANEYVISFDMMESQIYDKVSFDKYVTGYLNKQVLKNYKGKYYEVKKTKVISATFASRAEERGLENDSIRDKNTLHRNGLYTVIIKIWVYDKKPKIMLEGIKEIK